MSTHRLLLFVGSCLIIVTAAVVYRDLTHLRNKHEQTNGLSRGNVPLDEIPEVPSPFLEDQPLTGSPQHALLLEGETEEPAFDLLTAEDSEIDILSGEAPPELPKTEEVDPVPLLTPERRKENIAAIKEVLPDVTDERLEFWLEETRDMPPEMIRDMLMLRRHFGALSDSFSSDRASPPLTADNPKAVIADPARELLLAARALVLQNMMNENSIGYLATKLVFVENRAETSWGVRLADTYLLTRLGGHQRTDRPLDIAFRHSHTFLLVYDNGQPRLTKYGRLRIGSTGQLQLAVTGTELIVAPGLTVPEGVRNVAITPQGEVVIPDNNPELEGEHWDLLGKLELMTVREPAYLQPVGTACYVPTRRSGAIMALAETSDKEVLVPGALQESNVDPQHESWQLERIDRWLKLLEEQKTGMLPFLKSSERPKSHGHLKLDIF